MKWFFVYAKIVFYFDRYNGEENDEVEDDTNLGNEEN